MSFAEPTNVEPAPWALWQLIDSAFPVGGFAHSGGLEAAVQLGDVRDGAALRAFAVVTLEQAASFAAPFALASRAEPSAFAALDAAHHAALRNAPASAASRTQGQALLAIAAETWPEPSLTAARAALRGGQWRGHFAVAFGLVAARLGLGDAQTADAFLFNTLRGTLSAAVRLNLVGPREAQRLQASVAAQQRDRLVARALATPLDDAGGTSPVLELLQAQHGRLYSKLFVS